MVRSFSPAQANTVNIDVSATSQRVLVGSCNSPMTVRVMNNGTATPARATRQPRSCQ